MYRLAHRSIGTAHSLILVLSLAPCLLPSPVRAEINAADSLEAMVADSLVVARGRVDEVGVEVIGDYSFVKVSMTPTEVFRGRASNPLVFYAMQRPNVLELFQQAQSQDAEVLVFLAPGSRHASYAPAYADFELTGRAQGAPLESWVIPLWQHELTRAFLMDLTVLRTPEAIVDATRRIPAILPREPIDILRIDVPSDSDVFAELFMGSSVWLYVPHIPEDVGGGSGTDTPGVTLSVVADCSYVASHGWGHVYRCNVDRVETGRLPLESFGLHVAVTETDRGLALLSGGTSGGRFRLDFTGPVDDQPYNSGFEIEADLRYVLTRVEPIE